MTRPTIIFNNQKVQSSLSALYGCMTFSRFKLCPEHASAYAYIRHRKVPSISPSAFVPRKENWYFAITVSADVSKPWAIGLYSFFKLWNWFSTLLVLMKLLYIYKKTKRMTHQSCRHFTRTPQEETDRQHEEWHGSNHTKSYYGDHQWPICKTRANQMKLLWFNIL